MIDFGFEPEWSQRILKGLALARQASADLARQGWTTPLWFVPRQTCELLGSGEAAEVDANFLRLYEVGSQELTDLKTLLTSHPRLTRWAPLLSQTCDAYDRGHFAICIPALLSVLEGILMLEQGNRTKVRIAIEDRASREDPDSIVGWLWEAAAAFVRQVFATASFDGERPPVINRHWILHGRDVPQWSQADCLRLMQAIGVIVDLETRGQFPV